MGVLVSISSRAALCQHQWKGYSKRSNVHHAWLVYLPIVGLTERFRLWQSIGGSIDPRINLWDQNFEGQPMIPTRTETKVQQTWYILFCSICAYFVSSCTAKLIFYRKISVVAPPLRDLNWGRTTERIEKRSKKPGTRRDSNPRPLCYAVCTLPLCYNCCHDLIRT